MISIDSDTLITGQQKASTELQLQLAPKIDEKPKDQRKNVSQANVLEAFLKSSSDLKKTESESDELMHMNSALSSSQLNKLVEIIHKPKAEQEIDDDKFHVDITIKRLEKQKLQQELDDYLL